METPTAPPLSADLTAKRDRLLDVLRGLGKTAVAFSGGIDSTVVAKAAFLALGDNAVAVTADSPSVPRAKSRTPGGWPGRSAFVIASSPPTSSPIPITSATTAPAATSARASCIAASKRCCRGWACDVICSGANLDDRGDYRPGLKAAAEHRVRHPLQEAGFTKADVRALAWRGACRPGTSRRRRACRAGWRPAWK